MREDLQVIEDSSQPPVEPAPDAPDDDAAFVKRLAETLDDLFRFACRLEHLGF